MATTVLVGKVVDIATNVAQAAPEASTQWPTVLDLLEEGVSEGVPQESAAKGSRRTGEASSHGKSHPGQAEPVGNSQMALLMQMHTFMKDQAKVQAKSAADAAKWIRRLEDKVKDPAGKGESKRGRSPSPRKQEAWKDPAKAGRNK